MKNLALLFILFFNLVACTDIAPEFFGSSAPQIQTAEEFFGSDDDHIVKTFESKILIFPEPTGTFNTSLRNEPASLSTLTGPMACPMDEVQALEYSCFLFTSNSKSSSTVTEVITIENTETGFIDDIQFDILPQPMTLTYEIGIPPYSINSEDQLIELSLYGCGEFENQHCGTDFQLATDVTFTENIFKGIGSRTNPYTGIFDGLTNKISNLVIFSPLKTSVGFFNSLSGIAQIKNLDLEIDVIVGFGKVGGLVGSIPLSTVLLENINISGSLDDGATIPIAKILALNTAGAASQVGGLIGEAVTTTVTNCRLKDIEVTTPGKSAGGLAGSFSGGTINSSLVVYENVIALASSAGGLVGLAQGNLTISYSAARANNTPDSLVWSTNASGGLIGKTEGFGTSSVTIGASFAMINTVSSSANSAGGLIGEATRAVNILNSYSKENDSAANGFVVAGANYAGGLIGLVNIPSDGDSLLITHSFSSVDVLSNKYSGGIAGAVIHSSPTASLNISTSFVAPAIINSLEDFQGGMFGKVDVNTNITDSFSSAKLTTASPGSYKTGLVASWISGDIAINGEVHWVKETGYNDFVPFAAWDFTTLPISKLSSDIGVSTVLQESNFTSLPTFFPISPWSNPAGFETPTFDTTVFNSATHSLTADLFFLDPTFGKPNN